MSSDSNPCPPAGQQPEPRPEPGAVPGEATPLTPPKRRSRRRQALLCVAGLLLAYLVVAYVILPLGWIRYAHRHPSLEDIPRITHTIADIPGDPLNVAVIGTETRVKKIMLAAKWH